MLVDECNQLRSAFFDKTDLIIALFDKELNYIDVNEGLLKRFNFKREDIIGKNLAQISEDVISSGRIDLYRKVIETGQTLVIEDVKPHSSLGNFHFRVSAFKLGEGMGLVSHNITDLKESIEELETFIYKSSHDMRAPLASTLGLLNIVDEEVDELEELKRINKMIRRQVLKLESVLKVLVDTTRMRTDEKVIYQIDFKEIIQDVESTLGFMDGYDSVDIKKEILIKNRFYSDKNLISSLFQNLIENAIKYKRENVNSFLIISVTDENNGVAISFTDNGIGIPDELQNKVFKMFFRATDQAKGSGLGLYTVKHAVKKLNGQIRLESKEGEGTKFTIYLPNEVRPVETRNS